MIDASSPVTRLLRDASNGDDAAVQRLFPLVYDELRSLAGRYMSNERCGHTLQPTALVNEAYVRLVGPGDAQWRGRSHFVAVAAQAMRRILIDHLRRKLAAKRGGDREREPLDPSMRGADDSRGEYVIALDAAMHRLAEFDSQACRVVELRFFGGLTVEAVAEVLHISPSTVKRDWQMAKGWLHRRISEGCIVGS